MSTVSPTTLEEGQAIEAADVNATLNDFKNNSGSVNKINGRNVLRYGLHRRNFVDRIVTPTTTTPYADDSVTTTHAQTSLDLSAGSLSLLDDGVGKVEIGPVNYTGVSWNWNAAEAHQMIVRASLEFEILSCPSVLAGGSYPESTANWNNQRLVNFALCYRTSTSGTFTELTSSRRAFRLGYNNATNAGNPLIGSYTVAHRFNENVAGTTTLYFSVHAWVSVGNGTLTVYGCTLQARVRAR